FIIIKLKIYCFIKHNFKKKGLPILFDTRLSEKNGSGKKSNSQLIRIEAFIREEKEDDVLAALNQLRVPATFYESKGIGKGEKYQIRYGRRGDISTMPYSNRRTVETIVTEDKVDEVVSAIKEAAKIDKTGGAGGILAISKVDEIINI
ncbi:MAG TPA: P-II family nitrogen regulator, partial [Nitrososphaeraceae archaeon]|nr:P-II family nitrogen regulator [Nitrososphaeraceae archaeon]